LNIASDIRTSNAQNAAGSGYISTDSVRPVHILFFVPSSTNDPLFTLLIPDRRVLLTGEIQLFLSIYSVDLIHRLADLQLPVEKMLNGIAFLLAAGTDNIFLFSPSFLIFNVLRVVK
jgi:hypothetical protein